MKKNKPIKLLFVFGVILLFFISLIPENADARSLRDFLKNLFSEKNIQPIQAQPYNKVPESIPNYGKSNNNRNINYLDTLKDKCIIKDKILNYCKNAKTLKQFRDYKNPYYYFNEFKSLSYGDSMMPLIPPGTQLMMQRYFGDKLYSCEIVRFYNSKTNEFFIHRIVGKNKNGDLVTKGDNNDKNNYEVITKDKITHRICGRYDE